ncbi:MAG: hypothetical protein ASARMPREDX12_004225 [Alectoria sarmentosa]|nr:MAG: hypothetical protein ASARMPREDX12_004225 [Alectoria sarmentosa]
MEQGQSFKSNNHLVSTTDEAQRTGKFNLQSLPTEIQLDIIRHLILDHDTIEIGPPKEREFVPRRSLSILRVSKQFSALSSSVLYGDNLFVMSDDSILYHPHSSSLGDRPQDARAVLSPQNTGGDWSRMIHPLGSVKRLDMLSLPTPAQTMLKRLAITASRDMMRHFYDYSLLVLLIRMRNLRLLRFVFKEEEFGNGLRYFQSAGEGPESNRERFMTLVDCELAHVKEVVVEDSTVVDHTTDYGVALLRLVSELGERNKDWELSEPRAQTFWGGCMGKDGGSLRDDGIGRSL